MGQLALVKVITKLGGAEIVAQRLGIPQSLFGRFLTGTMEVPDAILLRAVDCILEDVPEVTPLTQEPVRAPKRA